MKFQQGPAAQVLIVSHCVPECGGDPARSRAWRLLEAAAAAGGVSLLAMAEGPVNLAAWRRLDAATQRLSLISGSLTSPARRRLEATLATWAVRDRFDAVLCTHPRLWWAAADVEAELRVCDAEPPTFALAGVWRRWFAATPAARRTTPAPSVVLTRSEPSAAAGWSRPLRFDDDPAELIDTLRAAAAARRTPRLALTQGPLRRAA